MPWRELRSSIIFTVVALVLAFADGLRGGGLTIALEAVFTTAVLAILEVSLSVDNAIINASVLRKMTPVWQKRFLTWGILTAVFGMRVIFPIVVVSLAAWITPLEAVRLALFSPDVYAERLLSSHLRLAGFGSAFLFMVFVYYFCDPDKEEHWIGGFERALQRLGRIPLFRASLFVVVFLIPSRFLAHDEQAAFLVAAICGMGAFLLIHALTQYLRNSGSGAHTSLYLFLYLEILDASFSFDGVIGGFALTHDLIILALGLGIGAMFVRGLTIWLVRKDTLAEFKYLEHGAFYAIGSLALLMLVDVVTPVPEIVSGGVGLAILALSFWSSLPQAKQRDRA